MHNIQSLIHVEKSILKGQIQPIKANKNQFRKNMNIFFLLDILGQWLLTIIKQDFLRLVTLYSCTIELIPEELKDIG